MQVVYRQSFARDLKKVRSKKLLQDVRSVLELLERSATLHDVPNVKRLTGNGAYYRIRVGEIDSVWWSRATS